MAVKINSKLNQFKSKSKIAFEKACVAFKFKKRAQN